MRARPGSPSPPRLFTGPPKNVTSPPRVLALPIRSREPDHSPTDAASLAIAMPTRSQPLPLPELACHPHHRSPAPSQRAPQPFPSPRSGVPALPSRTAPARCTAPTSWLHMPRQLPCMPSHIRAARSWPQHACSTPSNRPCDAIFCCEAHTARSQSFSSATSIALSSSISVASETRQKTSFPVRRKPSRCY